MPRSPSGLHSPGPNIFAPFPSTIENYIRSFQESCSPTHCRYSYPLPPTRVGARRFCSNSLRHLLKMTLCNFDRGLSRTHETHAGLHSLGQTFLGVWVDKKTLGPSQHQSHDNLFRRSKVISFCFHTPPPPLISRVNEHNYPAGLHPLGQTFLPPTPHRSSKGRRRHENTPLFPMGELQPRTAPR